MTDNTPREDPFGAAELERLEARQDLLPALPVLREEAGLAKQPRASLTPAWGTCPHCGRQVLQARTDDQYPVVLDQQALCYALAHVHPDGVPRAVSSRAYADHTACCQGRREDPG